MPEPTLPSTHDAPAPLNPAPDAAPGAAPKTTDTVILFMHESAALIFSAVFVTVAMVMMWHTYTGGGVLFTGTDAQAHKDAYDRQKDIMLYGFSLVGTVTGYFLGRAPAERGAQQAQQTARDTQKQLTSQQQATSDAQSQTQSALKDRGTAEEKTAQIKAAVAQEVAALTPDVPAGAAAQAAAAPALAPEQVQARLADLLDRVNRIA